MKWTSVIDLGWILLFVFGILLIRTGRRGTPLICVKGSFSESGKHLAQEITGGMRALRGTVTLDAQRKKDWSRRLARTPLKGLCAKLSEGAKQKKDLEIYEAISYLRNTASLGGRGPGSADTVIEQLAERRGRLQPVYMRMLQLLRLNRKEAAAEYFGQEVDTPMGRDFGRLLIQWDELEPKALTETLVSHQRNLKEVRMTARKRKDEMISDLIYLPVILNVMLIFVNFIYVAYFIDQKDVLSALF